MFTGVNLTCERGGRTVFRRLDFQLEPGGALVLVGPNGSGKSSLLRLMARLIRPAVGRVAWDGASIDDEPEAHGARLHYVGHLDTLKPLLTAEENLNFWLALGGSSPDGSHDALAAFGLTSLATTPVRYLSAGQRRRLALARLIGRPAALWLLDEPTTSLDRTALDALHAAIARHRAGRGMVIVASHGELHVPNAATLALDRFQPVTGGPMR